MKLSIEKLFSLLFPLLVCSLYLPPVFYSLTLACLVILAGVALAKGHNLNYRQPLPWLFFAFFAVHLIGFFLSGNHAELSRGLQNKLSFILLPFVLMVFQPYLTEGFLKKLISVFIYATAIFCTALLLISAYKLFIDYQLLEATNRLDRLKWYRYFHASFLTHDYIHRSYLGLLIGAALFSSPYVLPKNRLPRTLFTLGISTLVLVLIFLQSRMILGAFVLCISIYAITRLVKTKSVKLATYLGIAIIMMSILGYFFSNSPYNRFNNVAIEEYHLDDKPGTFTGSTIRFAIWENSIDLIKENPIFGVGYGDLKEKRLTVYHDNNFKPGFKDRFNSHNQVLETQVIAGIPGTVALLSMFFLLAKVASNRKDNLLFILVLFLFLSMLTEAMFERQLAISFFCTYILALSMGQKLSLPKM